MPRYETGPGRTGFFGQQMSHYVPAGSELAACGVATTGIGSYTDESPRPAHMCEACEVHQALDTNPWDPPACDWCGGATTNGRRHLRCAEAYAFTGRDH